MFYIYLLFLVLKPVNNSLCLCFHGIRFDRRSNSTRWNSLRMILNCKYMMMVLHTNSGKDRQILMYWILFLRNSILNT